MTDNEYDIPFVNAIPYSHYSHINDVMPDNIILRYVYISLYHFYEMGDDIYRHILNMRYQIPHIPVNNDQ